ncbi:MAG: alpha/beta hydrolase [Clostridia bacterium]|nr:alpha/beta hydrolase [Clostridia bacterium]
MKKHRRLLSALLVVIGVIAICAGGVMLYASDYYSPSEDALAALATTETVTVRRTDDGLVFLPAEPAAGFIFYPGGKVEHTAYAPLMRALAEEGILCILTDMPLRLAVLDMDAAAGLSAQYPQVTRWSIGGHSLGGAMAASYAAENPDEFDGLVLLAAYSTAKLPEEGMAVASIYGTEDKVLAMDKYEQYRTNLPVHTVETVIPGGNHAQFGCYGAQSGDGAAAITAQEQIEATVAACLGVLTGIEN